MPAELTLAAALRDVSAEHHQARSVAVRNLAPALLDALSLRAPVWWTQVDHPQRDEVVAALERVCDHASPQDAALARVGLAELSAPTAHARASEALQWSPTVQPTSGPPLSAEEVEQAASFMRECGVIALSLTASAAKRWLASPASSGASQGEQALARETLEQITDALRELLEHPEDDVRFQAGPALVEVGDSTPKLEAELVAALHRELHPQVRANLISALSMFDPPGSVACDALAEVLANTEEGENTAEGWEAAMALAGARRPEGWRRIVAGLERHRSRGEALEALAVIGPYLDDDDRRTVAAAIRKRGLGPMAPVFTRVRAAYALARIEPEAGDGLLRKLARHLRPAVREAVAEARNNLEILAAADAPAADDPYRHADG